MSLFSEKLKTTISDSGVPVQELARQTGVSTAMLYKMQSGSRIPDSTETLEKIMDAMLVDQADRTDLLREYQIERIGNTKYLCFNEFKQLMGNLTSVLPLTAKRTEGRELEIPRVIKGGENLNAVVQYLLAEETSRPGGMIRICVPVEYNFCFECLSVALADCHSDFGRAVHLMFFQPTAADEALYNNMRTIRAVLPRMMTLLHYEPRYCYHQGPVNGITMYPYYLITSKGVLQISSDFQSGCFLSEHDIVKAYQTRFDEVARNHAPMMNFGETGLLSFFYGNAEMVKRYSKRGIKPVILGPAPCILPCLQAERAMKYLPENLSGDPEILSIMEAYFFGARNYGYINYFTMDGLLNLIKTGTIMEIQGPDVPKLSTEDVIFALEEFIRRTKEGTISFHVIRTDLFRSLSAASISIYEKELMLACDLSDGRAVFLNINERTLPYVARAYTETAEQLGDAYSAEESVALVENVLRRYHTGTL